MAYRGCLSCCEAMTLLCIPDCWETLECLSSLGMFLTPEPLTSLRWAFLDSPILRMDIFSSRYTLGMGWASRRSILISSRFIIRC